MPRENVIILLGPPGSGKGTVSPAIVQEFQIPQLSTGDMLRAAVAAGTETGKKASELMKTGALVPDELVIDIIAERIKEHDCSMGFLLDGFPRTVSQAKALDELLAKSDDMVTRVVELSVPDEVLTERICGRWIHKESGRSYHVKNKPPKSYDGSAEPTAANMLDDETGEPLYQRADDTKDALPKRLQGYHDETVPILQHYGPNVCMKVNANQEMDYIESEVLQLLAIPSGVGDAMKDMLLGITHLDELVRYMPAEIQNYITSDQFNEANTQHFKMLDKDQSGFLDEQEIIPVASEALKAVIAIQDNVANPFECNVTQTEVKRFLSIFDRDKNGVLSLSEFSDFMKFSICRSWIEMQYRYEVEEEESRAAENAMIMEGNLSIEKQLEILQSNIGGLDQILGCLPDGLGQQLMSDDFREARIMEFNGLDKDKSGTLEVNELFPLIEAIADVHPFSISYEHCMRFLDLFDQNRDGVLQLEEYVQLVRYVVALAALEHMKSSTGDDRDPLTILREENARLKKTLDKSLQKNTELKRQLDEVMKGAVKESNEEYVREKTWRMNLETSYSDLLADYRRLMEVATGQKKELVKSKSMSGVSQLPGVTKSSSSVRLGRNLMG